MSMHKRIVRWRADVDPEEELWVCESCGAELHSDCVGETCPVCGVSTEPDPKEPAK